MWSDCAIKVLISIVVLALCGAVYADSTIYGSDGRRIVTKSRDGGDTGYYGSDGRRFTTEQDRGDSRRFYGRDGELDYDEDDD